MTSKYLIFLLIGGWLFSCGAAKSSATEDQIAALETLINQRAFVIESDWAIPRTTNSMMAIQNSGLLPPGSNASRISLIGNPNYLKISGDSVSSFLPYYGERQIINSYNGRDSSIEFNGLMEDYQVTKNENHRYTIAFGARSHNEDYNVTIEVFPNLTTDIFLTSGKRFTIRYRGKMKPTKDRDTQIPEEQP